MGGYLISMRKKGKGYRRIAAMLVLALLANLLGVMVAGQGASAAVKSLYVVSNHSNTFDSYVINANGTVTWQATHGPTALGALAGVAIDESSTTLFMTSEVSGSVEIVDATTMGGLGTVPTGGGDLAGIEADDTANIVYTIDRNTNVLYAFDWVAGPNTLIMRAGFPKNLGTITGWGMALDEINGVLYIVDSSTSSVRGYDTTTWAEVWSHAPTQDPMDVAVDRARGKLYTTLPDGGCAWGPSGGTGIVQIDIATKAEVFQSVGYGTMGVAVDEVFGYVYYTTGCGTDNLEAYDPSDGSQVDTHQGIGNSPAGLVIPQTAVTYNPLHLAKDDGLGGQCVDAGDTITYTISYDNLGNNAAVSNVVIVDTLPVEVTYVSNTGGGVYNAGPPETVTWNIGPLAANDAGGSVTVTVTVNAGVTPGSTITDVVSIDSNETGQAFADAETDVCDDITPQERTIPGMTDWAAILTVAAVGGLAVLVLRRRGAAV